MTILGSRDAIRHLHDQEEMPALPARKVDRFFADEPAFPHRLPVVPSVRDEELKINAAFPRLVHDDDAIFVAFLSNTDGCGDDEDLGRKRRFRISVSSIFFASLSALMPACRKGYGEPFLSYLDSQKPAS